MSETLDCEVLVVGSGPGGSVTASKLARAGFDVLLIEEGPDARGSAVTPHSSEEMDLKYRNSGLTPCLGRARLTYAEGRCLGGGSEVNAGFFQNAQDEVLRSWNIPDLDLAGLEPYYAEIVERLHIAPLRETEDRTSSLLKGGADRLGWGSEDMPRWIESRRTLDGRWHSKRHGMTQTYIADAEAAGARVVSSQAVDRLVRKGDRVVGARGRRVNGHTVTGRVHIRCRYAFVCAGAIGTPALLRRSGITRHVGNTLQLHPMARVVASFADEVAEGDFGVPVRQINHFKPELTLGCSVSTPAHLALWMTGRGSQDLEEIAPRTAVFYALVRSTTRGRVRHPWPLPEPLVFFDLSRSDYGRLADGMHKLCEVLFAAGAQQIMLPMPALPAATTLAQVEAMLARIPRVRPEITAIHLFASCPLGSDGTAPLDPFGKVREVSNLFVNDCSMLPGALGGSPQGTVMAISMRNVDRFLSAG